MVLCYRCHRYKDEKFSASYDDPLAQVCDECKQEKEDEGNLTLEKEWEQLVQRLYAERRQLKGRIDQIDETLMKLEREGVLRVNKDSIGE